jgi:hypothetical protein
MFDIDCLSWLITWHLQLFKNITSIVSRLSRLLVYVCLWRLLGYFQNHLKVVRDTKI